MILLCLAMKPMVDFILCKEGSAHKPHCLKVKVLSSSVLSRVLQESCDLCSWGHLQVFFSEDSFLYLLSNASAPVELIVSGKVI